MTKPGCLGFLFGFTDVSEDKPAKPDLDARWPVTKTNFLSKTEIAFFAELRKACSGLQIFPNARILDFINVENVKGRRTYLNKMSGHVDFLICNQQFEPIMAIEIDDKSHNS